MSPILRLRRGATGALFAALVLVLPPRSTHAEGAAPHFEYTIDVAADLSRLDVRLAFTNFEPRRLMLAMGGPLDAVRFKGVDGEKIEVAADLATARVASLDARGGFDYAVDLDLLGRRRGGVSRVGLDLVTQTGAWLVRPIVLPDDARFSIVVRTPPGVRFASPWPISGTTVDPTGTMTTYCLLDRSTWNMVGHAVFGRFARETLSIAGATIDLVTLSAPHKASADGIRRWVRAAVEGIALLYGRFPAPRVSVFVVPVHGGRGDPVPFGSTWYGGGPHVLLDLSDGATDEDLVGEWVALHELLHTTMPSIRVEDAWLSEGFVTYYQEVLRARARYQAPLTSWQLIEEGFGRGRATGSGVALSEESASMRSKHTYFRVYWAGAAIAMKLDVELRRESGGRRTLDDVMKHWARRIGNETDVTADDLVADADGFLGGPTLASIARPILASNEFPSVEVCYRWLGLGVREGRVFADASSEGARERERIVGPTPVPAVGPTSEDTGAPKR